MTFTIINIILLFILVYSLLLYPVFLLVLSKIFKNDLHPKDEYEPNITFLIAAYNEEKYIGGAIQSIIDSDYDMKKIQLIVGSDGSTDRTVEIVKSYDGVFADLQVIEVNRGGKNAVLNELYPFIKNEIVYNLDADYRVSPDAIKNSVKFFADENVGAMIGKLTVQTTDTSSNAGTIGEGAYQKLDNFVKVKESEIWTTVNNLGCYAIRTNLIKTIPNNKVCDDFFHILSVVTAKKRAITTNVWNVYEIREKNTFEEVKRRERMVAGSIATSIEMKKIFSPTVGWGSFFYISHKFLKLIMPFHLLAILNLTPFMYQENTTIFWIFAIGQAAFYLFALIGFMLEKLHLNIKLFSFPYFLMMLNIGIIRGFYTHILDTQSAQWERIDTVNK